MTLGHARQICVIVVADDVLTSVVVKYSFYRFLLVAAMLDDEPTARLEMIFCVCADMPEGIESVRPRAKRRGGFKNKIGETRIIVRNVRRVGYDHVKTSIG